MVSTHGGFFHTQRARAFKQMYFQTVTRQSLGRVEAVVCVSQHDRQVFSRIVPPQRIRVIENGANIDDLWSLKKRLQPGLMLGISRLAENKCVHKVLEAMALLKHSYPQLRLEWVGADFASLRAGLERRVVELGLAGRVHFHGAASREQVYELLEQAHMFVSASSYEGFGLSTIEAMSAATVVLVTAVGAHPNVIEEGVSGLLMDQQATGLGGSHGTSAVHARRETRTDGGSGARGCQTLFLEPDRTPVRATLSRGDRPVSTAARRESSLLSATQQKALGTVLIFRIQLLPPSETFIVTQAAAMQQFSPYFVGWRKMAGIELPAETSWTVDGGGLRGKLRELRFRYAGPSSEQLARLRARAPRLVYAHFAPDAYAAMQLADRLGVPLVTALHGFDVTMTDQAIGATRLGREYLRGRSALQKMGALFVACSDFVRGRALELGYPAERTLVHSIGADIETFQPLPARQRQKIVLFVGRLVEKKDCGSLINAMVEVAASQPGSRVGGHRRWPIASALRGTGGSAGCSLPLPRYPANQCGQELDGISGGLLCAQRGGRLGRCGRVRHRVYRGPGHGSTRGEHPQRRHSGGGQAWRNRSVSKASAIPAAWLRRFSVCSRAVNCGSVSRSPAGRMLKLTSTSPAKPGDSKRSSNACSPNVTRQESVRHGATNNRRKRRSQDDGTSRASLLSAGARRIKVLRIPGRFRLPLAPFRAGFLCSLPFARALAVGRDRQVRRGGG